MEREKPWLHKTVKKNAIATVLSILCVYVFYAMNSGITITNDGSHFALFDSLVTTGSPELKQVRQFAFGDSAEYNGKFYSDRNPGLALFTVAFYQGAQPLEKWMKALRLDPGFARNYTEGQRSRISLVMLVPAVSGGLVLLFTFFLARQMGVALWASILASLSILFGTIMLRYSTVFYSHSFSAALLVCSLWLIFSYRKQGSLAALFVGVFCFSFAVLAEHLLVVVFLPVLVYLLVLKPRDLFRFSSLLGVVVAGLMPMSVLMMYNWVCFDSPFVLAHFHHSHDTANHEITTLLRLDQSLGVAGNLLFGAPESEVGRKDLVGLFSASPFLYSLALFPLLVAKRYSKFTAEHAVLAVSVILLMLGASSVWEPYGGWDRDYRYFVVAVPLLAPFVGAVLDFLLHAAPGVFYRSIKYLAILAFFGLCYISVKNQLAHVRHELQVQPPHLLINYDSSLVNVSLLLGFLIACAVVLLFLYKAVFNRARSEVLE